MVQKMINSAQDLWVMFRMVPLSGSYRKYLKDSSPVLSKPGGTMATVFSCYLVFSAVSIHMAGLVVLAVTVQPRGGDTVSGQ